MATNDFEPLRALLHRAIARYLTITPRGVILAGESQAMPRVAVRIMGYGGARTLYRKHKPVCRSLDGVAAVTHQDKRCAECGDKDVCTPQVRVDLIVRGRPYRLLLAFTGARNFLEYVARLDQRGIKIADTEHEISVVPRGAWGEVRFREIN
jgi:hypothetical protein